MTIGELLIKIGFKLEGDKDLQGAERSMSRATGSAVKLAVEVAAVTAAFLYMIETSMKAGVMLRNFALSTGYSTGELQMWQHAAVVNGLTANDMVEGLKALQTARSNFALNNPQAVGAWGMLGVDPTQGNPFQLLERLRKQVRSFQDVGVSRNLVEQLGLGNLFVLLRSSNAEWEKWSRSFIVTGEQAQRLAALNAAWESLKMSVTSLATQFSATFVPILTLLAKGLEWVAAVAATFVRWLQSASPLAAVLRVGIQFLAVALLALGVILTGLVAVLGTFAAITAALAIGVGILGLEFIPFILVIGAAGVAVVALGLLLNDLWVNVKGGKSAFDWLHSSDPIIWSIAHGLENILKLWKELKSFNFGSVTGTMGVGGMLQDMIMRPGPGNSSHHQEIHNEVNVHEAVSAKSTAREVLTSLQELHRGAMNQAPVRSY